MVQAKFCRNLLVGVSPHFSSSNRCCLLQHRFGLFKARDTALSQILQITFSESRAYPSRHGVRYGRAPLGTRFSKCFLLCRAFFDLQMLAPILFKLSCAEGNTMVLKASQ